MGEMRRGEHEEMWEGGESSRGKSENPQNPRNGRRSRKAIYLLGAYLSPAIRERACRQIRHASSNRRINFAAKDPPEKQQKLEMTARARERERERVDEK